MIAPGSRDVCMQFGMGAQFVIDRKMGREVTREEALAVLDKAAAAGLVHATANRQEVDLDQCIGCGVCASGCDFDDVTLAERAGVTVPPTDQVALRAAIKASQVQ